MTLDITLNCLALVAILAQHSSYMHALRDLETMRVTTCVYTCRACMYVCMYVCMYTYVYIYISCVCVLIYIYTYTCTVHIRGHARILADEFAN